MIAIAGCGYPEFGFTAGPADATIDSAIVPTEDVAADDGADTTVADDTLDVDDTASVDTLVSDTGVDTVMPDTPSDSTYCMKAPLHVFCSDWDTSTEPTYGWASFNTTGGGTLAVDATAFSTPRSFLASFPAGANASSATLARTFTAPAIDTVARIDFRVRLAVASYSDGVMLVKLQRPSGRGASIWLGSSGLYVEALGSTYKTYPISKGIAAATWYHVRLETSLKISSAVVRVYVDDMTSPLVNVSDASTADDEAVDRELVTGVYASKPTGLAAGFFARIDDLSLDWL